MPIETRHRQRGFSLVELTVATAIYSMGLGSLSLMLLLAVQGTTETRFETTATVQLSSLAEMILMNTGASTHYALAREYTGPACDLGHACSAEEMAGWQIARWREGLAAQLPQGRGLVCRDGTPDDGDGPDPRCDGQGSDVIKVFWQPAITPGEADGSPARQVLRLP